MRVFLSGICFLGLVAGIYAGQSASKLAQVPVRYEPPSVVSSAEAVYPMRSVASGTVVLELSLDENAKITDIRVVHGIASLTEPAKHSAKQWKFHPAMLDGKPVASKFAVAFTFVPPNVGPRV